jgi:hypothetical protein
MTKKLILLLLALPFVTACGSTYIWAKEDGTHASATDLADCRKQASKNNFANQHVAPIDFSSGTIQRGTPQRPYAGLQHTQLNYACMSGKGYKQIQAKPESL